MLLISSHGANAALTGALVSLLGVSVSCHHADAPTASFFPKSASAVVSFTLEPSVVRVNRRGSAETIGFIRGVSGPVLSAVLGMPAGVSARVLPGPTSDSVTTRTYSLFADDGAALGTYLLNVRVTVNGYTDAEAPLTLVVAAAP